MDLAPEKKQYDVSAMEIAKMVLDNGMHPPTMYFPLIVHEALMVEPTETESKETLDAAAEAYLKIYDDAIKNPAYAHEAPHNCALRRLDEVGAARNPIVKYSFE